MRLRRTAFAFVLSSMMVMSGPCTLHAAEGLQIGYEPAARFAAGESGSVLVLRGEIQLGDSRRLEQFIRTDPDKFIQHGATVVFVVDGGDVEEAFRVGELLRLALLHVWLPDVGSTRCLSACFFMFANAVSRDAVAGSVGIHRPYIEAQAIEQSDPEAVRGRYGTLMREVRERLDALWVPRNLIEKMLRTPWNEHYLLTDSDLERLGDVQPWFEDYTGAKCRVAPALARRLRRAQAAGFEAEAKDLRAELEQARSCVDRFLRAHRRAFVNDLKGRTGDARPAEEPAESLGAGG